MNGRGKDGKQEGDEGKKEGEEDVPQFTFLATSVSGAGPLSFITLKDLGARFSITQAEKLSL